MCIHYILLWRYYFCKNKLIFKILHVWFLCWFKKLIFFVSKTKKINNIKIPQKRNIEKCLYKITNVYILCEHCGFSDKGTGYIQYWKKKKQGKNERFFNFFHKFWLNFSGLNTHRKWLFTLIIVVKVPLLVANSHNFQKRKFSEIPKDKKVLWIFSSLIWYPNLQLVFC